MIKGMDIFAYTIGSLRGVYISAKAMEWDKYKILDEMSKIFDKYDNYKKEVRKDGNT